jgi:hypothetical protein
MEENGIIMLSGLTDRSQYSSGDMLPSEESLFRTFVHPSKIQTSEWSCKPKASADAGSSPTLAQGIGVNDKLFHISMLPGHSLKPLLYRCRTVIKVQAITDYSWVCSSSFHSNQS